MRFRSWVAWALVAGLGLSGCAPAATGAAASGPRVSATGHVYEPGTPPVQTRFAQTATISLVRGDHQEALAQSRDGIAADPSNPIHYYIAGEAAAGLGNVQLADSMWTVAERIFPAYELDIEPARENAWAAAFNEGVGAYNEGDLQAAVRAWQNAHFIYRLRADASQNLALLLTQDGRYDEAMRVYREALEGLEQAPASRELDEEELADRAEARASMQESLVELLLFNEQYAEAEQILRQRLAEDPTSPDAQVGLASALAGMGRAAEATELYGRLLQTPGLTQEQLFNVGVSLFNADQFAQAAEAFGRVAQMQPNHRDALYNQANALYAAESWATLVPVATQLVQVDPLNENAGLILARAQREVGENQRALAALQRISEAPVYLDEMQLLPRAQQTLVRGRVVGNAATTGTAVRIRFTFYGPDGQVGTETVTVTAPAREQSAPLELTFNQAANAYRYDVVQ
jgi:tetratricopeptide (TPR) repeat protein